MKKEVQSSMMKFSARSYSDAANLDAFKRELEESTDSLLTAISQGPIMTFSSASTWPQ